jgi:hypothetical protein
MKLCSCRKLTIGAAAALTAISLSPVSAKALVVTVNSVQYDVTTFTGTYNNNTSQFETAANGGVMPWWGSSASAEQFAITVGTSLGIVNNCQGSKNCGPFFAYAISGTSSILNYRFDQSASGGVGGVLISPLGAGYHASRDWAQATLHTPVPGPLPLFGVGAAFTFSRRLRKKIKSSTTAVSST